MRVLSALKSNEIKRKERSSKTTLPIIYLLLHPKAKAGEIGNIVALSAVKDLYFNLIEFDYIFTEAQGE